MAAVTRRISQLKMQKWILKLNFRFSGVRGLLDYRRANEINDKLLMVNSATYCAHNEKLFKGRPSICRRNGWNEWRTIKAVEKWVNQLAEIRRIIGFRFTPDYRCKGFGITQPGRYRGSISSIWPMTTTSFL
jgi:hypothetical protein